MAYDTGASLEVSKQGDVVYRCASQLPLAGPPPAGSGRAGLVTACAAASWPLCSFDRGFKDKLATKSMVRFVMSATRTGPRGMCVMPVALALHCCTQVLRMMPAWNEAVQTAANMYR